MNRRYPRYPDDADYQTNAPSYYEDLARKNKLIKHLAERIWEYDKTLANSLQDLKDRLDSYIILVDNKLDFIDNLIGDGFNDRIEILLREWVSDGTLNNIINEEIFNTKADKVDLDLLEEKFEDYKEDIDSNINDLIQDSIYYDFEYERKYDEKSNTIYYVTKIPKKDDFGNDIELNYEVFDGMDGREERKTILDFAKTKNSSLAFNAGMRGGDGRIRGKSIVNGEIIGNNFVDSPYSYTLAIDYEGWLKSYPPGSDIDDLINDGVKHAVTSFIPLYEDGLKKEELFDLFHFNEKHPRQAISQSHDGTIYLISTGGRGVGGDGMTVEELYNVVVKETPQILFAYNLDGGGSTQTVIRQTMINESVERNFSVGAVGLRKRPDAFYIKKTNIKNTQTDKNLKSISNDIGEIKRTFDIFKGVSYGVWEPKLHDTNGEINAQYSVNKGEFIRIGSIMILFYHIKISQFNHEEIEGPLRLGGLPSRSDKDSEIGRYVSSIGRVSNYSSSYAPTSKKFFINHLAGSVTAILGTVNDDGIPENIYRDILNNGFEINGNHIYRVEGNEY